MPLYAYAATPTLLATYQNDFGALATSAGSASVASQVTTCGINPQGVLLDAPATAAAYLDVKISLTGAAAANNAAVVSALDHTTAYVLAMRAQGLPSTAAVQLTSPPSFSAMVALTSGAAAVGRGAVRAALALCAAALLAAGLH